MSLQLYPSLAEPALLAGYDSVWRVAPASCYAAIVGPTTFEFPIEHGATPADIVTVSRYMTWLFFSECEFYHYEPRSNGDRVTLLSYNPQPLPESPPS